MAIIFIGTIIPKDKANAFSFNGSNVTDVYMNGVRVTDVYMNGVRVWTRG